MVNLVLRSALLDDRSHLEFDVDDARRTLDGAEAKLNSILQELNKTAAGSKSASIDQLDVAMKCIYRIAVFIHGDYDNHTNVDESERNELMHRAVSMFQEAQARADVALKTIGDFHAQVLEIQNKEIGPASQKFKRLSEQSKIELASTQDQINSAAAAMQTLRESLANQTSAVRGLEQKIADAEAAAKAVDIAWTILTYGLGNLITNDVLGLHHQLDAARQALASAHAELDAASGRAAALARTKARLDAQLAALQHVQTASLPRLEAAVGATAAHCVRVQRGFAGFKDTATQLLLKMRDLHDRAATAEAMACTKDEIAVALLGVCDAVLIDPALVPEVRRVHEEVLGGYGRSVPAEVASAASDVERKMVRLPRILARL